MRVQSAGSTSSFVVSSYQSSHTTLTYPNQLMLAPTIRQRQKAEMANPARDTGKIKTHFLNKIKDKYKTKV